MGPDPGPTQEGLVLDPEGHTRGTAQGVRWSACTRRLCKTDKSPDLCWLPLWLWGGAFQNQEMDRVVGGAGIVQNWPPSG